MDYRSIEIVRVIRPEIYTKVYTILKDKYKSRFNFDAFQDSILKFMSSPNYTYVDDVKEIGFIMQTYLTTSIDMHRRNVKSVNYDDIVNALVSNIENGKYTGRTYVPDASESYL